MNLAALAGIKGNAKHWAAAYTELVEELTRSGVPDEIAREEARTAVNTAAFFTPEVPESCPTCGTQLLA